MSLFGTAQGWGGKAKSLSKICHIYPTMLKLGKVIPYPKKIRKSCKSRDTPVDTPHLMTHL